MLALLLIPTIFGKDSLKIVKLKHNNYFFKESSLATVDIARLYLLHDTFGTRYDIKSLMIK